MNYYPPNSQNPNIYKTKTANKINNDYIYSNPQIRADNYMKVPPNLKELDYNKVKDLLTIEKKSIFKSMQLQKFQETIELCNKYLPLAQQIYPENSLEIIEILYIKAESLLNISQLTESKQILESINNIIENHKNTNTISTMILTYKVNMLLGSISINLGEYNIALKSYSIIDGILNKICGEPEYNVKAAALYLNIAICYIYLNNKNIAEKYLKKGLTQSEGIMNSETVYKLNSDLYENLGLVYEMMYKYKESLVYYKKALKLKFNLYGENNDEVLELQYKIGNVYLCLKQYIQAEEILNSMIEVINKEKNKCATQEMIYRYSAYYYTYGVVLVKLGRNNMAKVYLARSKEIMQNLLNNGDPIIGNMKYLIRICDMGKTLNANNNQ